MLEKLCLPFLEGMIDSDIEGNFGWGSFGKSIGYVHTIDCIVFQGSKSLEGACTSLVEGSGVGVVKGDGVFHVVATIAHTASFLVAILLDEVDPQER